MGQWYYGTPGDNPADLTPKETNGPHTKSDIVYLITEGHILETYLVKDDSWDQWKRVGDIPESVWKEEEPRAEPAPEAPAAAPVVPAAAAVAPIAVPEAPAFIPEEPATPVEQPSAESESSDFIPLANPPEEDEGSGEPASDKPPEAAAPASPSAPGGPTAPAPQPKEPRAAQVLSRFQRDHARCPDCTHTVSLWALSCPRCGRPTPGSQFAPPNAPSERAFRGSIYAWAAQLTISMLFIGGFLMSAAEVEHNARSGVLISALALSTLLILRTVLLFFYTQRSEIIRKVGITLAGLNIAHNIRSFMAAMLVLENGLQAPEWAANAVNIVANDWVPYEAATAIAGLIASACFILFAMKAKIAFPGKDPVLAFFRGERG